MDTLQQRRRKILFFILICSLQLSHGIPKSDFVTYGESNDGTLKSNAGFVSLPFPQNVTFYGNNYESFVLHPDVQLVAENSINVQESFQISMIPQITALKSNMDSRGNGGTIFYRISDSGDVLTEVSAIVSKSTSDSQFQAQLVVVVTYDDVDTRNSEGRNTFQIILAVQSTDVYGIFNYDKIDGVQTYGNHGFVKGDGTVYQKHPTTPSDLPSSTNVCTQGQYIYKIDGNTIQEPENCVSKPCTYGTCCDGGVARCVCDEGWMGDQCSEYDKCYFKGCHNGVCSINTGTGDAECACETGWTGELCDKDMCEFLPCINGKCSSATGKAICHCDFGWTGTACDIDVCGDCQNRGSCSLISPTKALCVCPPGYIGVECEIGICDITHCGNGQCNPATGECICNEGWIGNACDIALCDTNNCIRGQCEGEGNSVKCICDEGWTGDRCDRDEDECASSSSPCQHGLCINQFGSYRCLCDNGFVGESCDKPDADKFMFLWILTILGLIF